MAEPVAYTAIATALLVLVTATLEKAGVPSFILRWSVFVAIMLMAVLAANAVWPDRLSHYVVSRRRVSPVMAGIGQLMSVAPAGLALAYLGGGFQADVMEITLVGLVAGLWVSTLLIGIPLNRSGAYSLPQFLEVRFQSRLIRLLAVVLLAVPTMLLLCGQLLAFGHLAAHLLGLAPRAAIVICAAIACAAVWLAGSRGALIVGAVIFATLVIAFGAYYWLAGVDLAATRPAGGLPVAVAVDLPKAALPYLPREGALALPVDNPWVDRLAFAAGLAAAMSVMPVFTQFHPMAASGLKTLRSGLAATLLILVSAAVFGSIRPVAPFLNPDGASQGAFADLAGIALLATIPASAAFLLFGLAGLLSLDRPLGRAISENRKLIAARLTVLVLAVVMGWLTLAWLQRMLVPAAIALFACSATVFPIAVAAGWWRKCGALAALASMLAGCIATGGVAVVSSGLWDPRALLNEQSPVIEFLVAVSPAGAGLLGLVVAVFVLVVFAAFYPERNERSKALFDAIHGEREERPLNEMVL
ncbi:MAG: hypothetical protein R3D45_02130 [Rhizobiaceae bacterium]